jgi:hypothetical protein
LEGCKAQIFQRVTCGNPFFDYPAAFVGVAADGKETTTIVP